MDGHPHHAGTDVLPRSASGREGDGFHIPSLDGIRAVSFLFVFLAHGVTERIPGGFGVTVFFFLSGYLITTLLRMEYAKRGSISLRNFYLRRVLRIFPPLYIALFGGVLLTLVGVLPGALQLEPVVAQALHLTNYYITSHTTGLVVPGMPTGSNVMWSLAVEEHFYVLFPCLYIVLHRVTRRAGLQAMVLLAGCLAVLAWRCWLVYGCHVSANRTYMATDTRIDSIMCGTRLSAKPSATRYRGWRCFPSLWWPFASQIGGCAES